MSDQARLGVLAVPYDSYFPFGKQVFFFEDMMRSFPDAPFETFFFSPLTYQKGVTLIPGFIFKNGTWEVVERPLPKLIYDRAFSRDDEQKEQIRKCRKELIEAGCDIFNPLPLAYLLNDKVKFHDFLWLHKIPSLVSYEFSELVNLLRYATDKRFYIKPIKGSRGIGVYVVGRQNDRYLLYNAIGELIVFLSFAELLKHLQAELVDFSLYFIQDEAKIARFNTSPFDIRVLVQHDGTSYKFHGINARIGSEASMTSNLNTGGRALPLSLLNDFFEEQYYLDAKMVREQIESLCKDCIAVIEEEIGPFFEIGFDILLTKDKGPIVLEANAKPSRWIFNVIADYLEHQGLDGDKYKGMRTISVRMPLAFATSKLNL